ncbi:MAG TPA: hypothetical protein VMS71_01625, partial [Candidatus Acidoferrum sp.]|nr:hypothetical protein [Candidatus Acidoferrum sp.]
KILQSYSGVSSAQVLQVCRRVLPDSTAEVGEEDNWTSTMPNEKDSTQIDTVHEGRKLVVYIKPNGKIVDLQFASKIDSVTAGFIEQFYQQEAPVFPSREVKVGDTWSQSTDVKLDSGTVTAATNFALTAFAHEQGYDCAVITYTGNLIIPVRPSPDDSTKRGGVDRVQSSGTMYLATREGQIVLQKERLVNNGIRHRIKEGKLVDLTISTETETTYTLKERKVVTPTGR